MTGAGNPGGVTWELHERTPEGSARVTLPPDQWTPAMVEAFNGMTVCRLVPPELGPIEGMAIVKSMQDRLADMAAQRTHLERRVGELLRECDGLGAELARERRRAMLALESMGVLADSLAQAEDAGRVAREAFQTPLTADAWHEEIGPVLWWCFPVEEAPWCGTPHFSDWPGYHTHWTPLPGVQEPEPEPEPVVTACPVCEWAVDAAGECGCP